jgi:cobalt-zinc-cadmium efflux system outer membrane protein
LSSYSVAALVGVACVAGIIGEAAAQAPSAPLTREDAIARALGDDPGVDAADSARLAAEAGARQAGRWANPTLDILQENVSGSGPYRSSDRAETTYSLRQPLQLGGDRGARRRLAERELDTARVGAGVRRANLIEEVEHAYIDAQAAEAALVVAEERLTVARELSAAVDRRVRAARDPLMAGSRAEARLAEAEVEAEAARHTANAARARLASYWGGGGDFALERASFEVLAPRVSDADALSPDLALAEADAARAAAQVDVERARAIPDLDLQAGWRQFSERDETALVFGLSVPLQIWDRNGSGVARARAESARAGYERAARERAIMREQAMLAAQADTARREVEALDARIIPASERALAQARDGYAMGGFSYIDVSEAQRALVDARLRRVSALRSFHRAEVSIARLGGARIEPDQLRGTQP